MFCCLPLPRGRGLGRAHRLGVWEHSQCCLRNPPRVLWPFAQRNRNVTGELHPGPGPLSDPTQVTLSPFLLCVHGDVLVYLCLKQAPADVAHKSVGWVCPHPRGNKAGQDGENQGSTGCPGRPPLPQGCLLHPGWVPEQTHVSFGSRISSRQKQPPYRSGPAQ